MFLLQPELLFIFTELEDLISQRSILETSCNDLRGQLNNLKENKAALRQQIEQELRKKMYQHANLDKHIKHLSQLKDTLANARQAVSHSCVVSIMHFINKFFFSFLVSCMTVSNTSLSILKDWKLTLTSSYQKMQSLVWLTEKMPCYYPKE